MARTLGLVLAFATATVLAQGDLPEHFGLPATVRWFATVQATGRVDFSKPITFSYIFSYREGADVDALRTRLESDGFKFVHTYGDEGRKRLEVARKEIHTPESVVERNRQFRSLAAEFHNVQYDHYEITLTSGGVQ